MNGEKDHVVAKSAAGGSVWVIIEYDDVQLHHGTCSSQSPAFVHILSARR